MTPNPTSFPIPRRSAGILLHVTSLPGRWGIGEIGPEAIRWLRTLAKIGIGYWQILPCVPAGLGHSPYSGLSAFAGHALLISLEELIREGWLTADDVQGFPTGDPDRVDFDTVVPAREALLQKAASRVLARMPYRRTFATFRLRHADWLPDYALYRALKRAHEGRPWFEWPEPLARRHPPALEDARRRWAEAIAQEEVLQFWFDRQWRRLRRTANRLGIRIIGDIPIFVSEDSADVWARPGLFDLRPDGRPRVVAGVPPDYFSATGQRWGNPLYRWDVHAAEDYAWWIARMRRALELVDVVRLDHFRGLWDYWEIPAESPTAVEGQWRPGPRDALLVALRDALGGLPIIAEDLGIITEEVRAFRDRFGLPGMEVLQFLIAELPGCPDRLSRIRENSVIYTGTHDNDTTRGWFESLLRRPPGDPERQAALGLLGEQPLEAVRHLIEIAWRSPARLAVVPLQDLLALGSAARMNVPGVADGNWRWRFAADQWADETARWLRALTADCGRTTWETAARRPSTDRSDRIPSPAPAN